MELVKDIYFNTDKLIENTKVKVSYTGKFYQGNNDKVFLHYGYGSNWNNVNEIEMAKTDLGYQAELDLLGEDTINFCFKNQNNEWDNNFGKNYIFDIEKQASTVNPNENTKNLVFLGRTFGKKDENTSGVIEDVANSSPNSVDTVISSKAENVFNFANTEPVHSNVKINTPAENDCFKVIQTSFGNTNINGVARTGLANFDISDKKVNNNENVIQAFEIPQANSSLNGNNSCNIINPVNKQTETALVVAPTGFNYWTQKIKETVCKLFSYVPKLISGNYKRNLSNSNDNNK